MISFRYIRRGGNAAASSQTERSWQDHTLASHSKEDVDFLCDTVIRMDKGKIIERSNQ